MIVNRPLVYDLTVGDPLRLPEAGDANIIVPPTILPVALSLRPTIVPLSLTVPQESSGIAETLATRTNQAGVDFTILTLALGLWELEITLSTWFNYSNTAGGFNGVSFVIAYQGFNIIQLSRFALTNQSFNDYQRLRLLLTSTATLLHRFPVTGVGQSVDSRLTLNAIRIL